MFHRLLRALADAHMQMYVHDSSSAFSLYSLVYCTGLSVTSIIASNVGLAVISSLCLASTLCAVVAYISLRCYHMPSTDKPLVLACDPDTITPDVVEVAESGAALHSVHPEADHPPSYPVQISSV